MSSMFWLRIGCAERHSCTVSVIDPARRKLNEKVWSFVLDFERNWYPIASRTAGTHDYAPVCSIGDQVN